MSIDDTRHRAGDRFDYSPTNVVRTDLFTVQLNLITVKTFVVLIASVIIFSSCFIIVQNVKKVTLPKPYLQVEKSP